MELTMKYLDGTPVEPQYLNGVEKLINEAAEAERHYYLDDLEAYAARATVGQEKARSGTPAAPHRRIISATP